MTMSYIRNNYDVPAKRFGRVRLGGTQTGTIVGARGPHLRVRLDGETRAKIYHPLWDIEYLDQAAMERDGEC